jgi:hypothetical protein
MDPAFPTMQLRVRLLEASPASEGKLAAVDAVEAVHRGLESAKVSLSRPSSHGRLPRRMRLTHRIRDRSGDITSVPGSLAGLQCPVVLYFNVATNATFLAILNKEFGRSTTESAHHL